MKGKHIAVIAALGAAFAVAVGVATGAIPGSGGEIQGCYLKAGGVLRVIDTEKDQRCTRFETPLSWSQAGPAGPAGPQGDPGPQGAKGDTGDQGPAGTFSGELVSEDGKFSLSVTNDGIELSGPSGSIELNAAGLSIDSALPLSIQSSSTVAIEGAANVTVNGAQVRLNGCSKSVAGSGDPIAGSEVGGVVTGSIVGGSPTVCTG